MSALPDALPASPRSGWLLPGTLTVGVLLILGGVFWPTLYSMVEIWDRSETFTHGYLIFPISIWLIWRQRDELAQVPPRTDLRGLILLATAGAGWLLADAGSVNVVAQYAFIFMLIAAVWTLRGWDFVWAVFFPLLFLLFAVPVGEFLIPQLVQFTADFTVAAFPDLYWVVAEIASVRVNRHCYLELVERREESVVAQMRATLWAHDYKRIVPAFESATGEKLKKGMKVMLLTGLSFHEVYGMSLNIKGIDPTYTLGEMARKKQEIIERLGKEGLIDLNKRVPFPLVPQRIAVISSSTAAGYGDFIHQLEANPYGYRFSRVPFPALMQGDKAEESILRALDEALFIKGDFDTVVVIRGGGAMWP